MRYGRFTFPIFHAPDGGGSAPAGIEPVAAGSEPEGAPVEPMTFDQMLASNKDYQSEFDRRVSQGIETRLRNERAKWEQQQRDDLTEAEKLASMTAAQRQEYTLNKERAAFEAERAAFQRQQLTVSVGAELQRRGLSADFASMLTGEDAEASRANIDAFEAQWNANLQNAVNGRMRSEPPRAPTHTGGVSLDDIRTGSMSREEINKNWDAIQAALKEQKGK